jgi:hypothetical protein
VEITGNPDNAGTMETICYTNTTMFGSGAGNGPWLLADLEAGTYPSDKAADKSIPSITVPAFAAFFLNGFSNNHYALKWGDAQKGTLTTQWDGKRPPNPNAKNTYSPMLKQGAIILGGGGDGSMFGKGTFFEGAITSGCSDDKTVDDAIQASIVAAGFGK